MNIKNRGFTIVELLVVVVIIAILASITIVSYGGVTGRAYDTAVQSDLQNLRNVLELYKQTNGTYPAQGSISDIMTEITSNAAIKMKFSTSAYAKPDIYQGYPDTTIMVGFTTSSERNLCFVVKSKSGQNFVYATNGVVAKTAAVTSMGGTHNFETTCLTDGQMPGGSSLSYGPVSIL